MPNDITGTHENLTVARVNGVTAPSPSSEDDGDVMVYNHATGSYQLQPPTTAIEGASVSTGGDISGNSNAATVNKIQNKSVATPVGGDDGQFARYNSGTDNITWETPPASGAVTYETNYASLPAANEGDLDFLSDGISIQRRGASSWAPWGPIWKLTEPPLVAAWTWVNQGTATAVDAKGTIYLRAAAAAGNNFKILKRAAPTPPYVITALFIPHMHVVASNMFGMGWRENSSGKLMYIDWLFVSGVGMRVASTRSTSPTTGQVDYTSESDLMQLPYRWLRIADDNTNRIVYYSIDGITFTTLHTRARTDFDGGAAVSPDEVFFFCDAINAAAYVATTLVSWAIS